MDSTASKSSGIGKFIIVYVCILVIAGLQFVIAYQNIDRSQMLTRMLILAFVEAALGILFFMHLSEERRGLLWFVVIFMVAILAGMQYSWPDSARIEHGVPYATLGK